MDGTYHYETITFVTRMGNLVHTVIDVGEHPSPYVQKLIDKTRHYRRFGW